MSRSGALPAAALIAAALCAPVRAEGTDPPGRAGRDLARLAGEVAALARLRDRTAVPAAMAAAGARPAEIAAARLPLAACLEVLPASLCAAMSGMLFVDPASAPGGQER